LSGLGVSGETIYPKITQLTLHRLHRQIGTTIAEELAEATGGAGKKKVPVVGLKGMNPSKINICL
jgi:hypothetical protein